jgi:hypothetical protein
LRGANATKQSIFAKDDGLLRFARNDEQTAMMNCLASAVPALYRFRFEPEFATS